MQAVKICCDWLSWISWFTHFSHSKRKVWFVWMRAHPCECRAWCVWGNDSCPYWDAANIPTNLVVKYWKLAIAALLSLSLFDILPSKDATCKKLHFLLIVMDLFIHLSCSRWRRSGFMWTILLESPSSWQWNRMFKWCKPHPLHATHTNFCSNYSVLT